MPPLAGRTTFSTAGFAFGTVASAVITAGLADLLAVLLALLLAVLPVVFRGVLDFRVVAMTSLHGLSRFPEIVPAARHPTPMGLRHCAQKGVLGL